MIVLKVILALFLPPVAAALQVGLSAHFWINILLTLLGGIPGVIHALWLVLTDRHGPNALQPASA
ncbi:MAG: YqaE/Pmp3 family membrane protein [Planctomycetota bacterium]|jgi:uncharacterized membrane protein YqaE (UPF0057 family)